MTFESMRPQAERREGIQEEIASQERILQENLRKNKFDSVGNYQLVRAKIAGFGLGALGACIGMMGSSAIPGSKLDHLLQMSDPEKYSQLLQQAQTLMSSGEAGAFAVLGAMALTYGYERLKNNKN